MEVGGGGGGVVVWTMWSKLPSQRHVGRRCQTSRDGCFVVLESEGGNRDTPPAPPLLHLLVPLPLTV